MTPRRWASIAVRMLVVLGGAGILLVLGAAAAGASDSPAPIERIPVSGRAPSLPVPGATPITVTVPPSPGGANAPGLSIGLPGVVVEIETGGVGVGVNPPPTIPPVDLPTLPVDPPTLPSPVAAVPTQDLPAATGAPADPGSTTRRSHGHSVATALGAVAPATEITAAPVAPGAPEPTTPTAPPAAAVVLQLLGLAAGAELTSTRGAPNAAVLGTARALRNRLRLGVVRVLVTGGAPPGFGLLLVRPG